MNAHEKVPGVSFVGRFPLRSLTGGNKTSGREIPEEKVPLLQKLQEECASPRVPRSERRPIQSFAIVATDIKSASISNNPVKFDCVIIPPDADVDGLLDRLSTFEHQRSQHGEAGAEIHLIQSFEDLSKDNLRQRIHLKEGVGKCQRSPGKLFENNRPIRLVVDLQKMNPSDTVALNDLLDPENPTLNKIRLGSHVEILVLVQKKQLHAGNTYSLGADTCRRINRVENTWDYQKKLASLTSIHEQHRSILDFSPCATDENNPEASSINLCHGNVPWRQLLLGSYGVNTDRGFGWKAGVLEKEKPKTLCITDAPDGDLAFTQALRNIKITGEIEVKGEKVSLPEDMIFLTRQSGNEDRSRLLSSIRLVSNIPDGPLITINSANFNNWLSTVGINARGESCEHNPLEEAIQAGGSIMVTSSLKEAQWTQLLHRLASIVDVHKTKIPLTLLATRQPPSFFPASPDRLPQLAGDAFDQMIKVQRSPDQEALVNELCNRHPEAEIVRVNPETTLSQLVNNPHIVSEARYRYGFRWSGMMKALNANKPVILCGLEQNPRLQLELETLLLKPGHFFINGSKEQIPADSRIYLVWPEGARTESMVWQSAIEKEAVVTLPVAEQSLARNRLKAGLGKLQSALKTLPEKFSTIKLPTLSDALVQSVLNEVNAIVAQEGSAEALPVHYRKAISTVVTHVARENSQVRAFAKSITRQIWPDRPRDGYWVDIDKLTAFLGDGHRIDRNYIASNGWELVDMFGEGFFAYPEPMALDFNQSGHKETLIALICRHAPGIYQRALKNRLGCDDKILNELPDATLRSSVITRILNNALYAGWAFCKQQGIPTQTRLDNLSTRILDIQKNTPANQQQTVIRSLLKRHFIINGVDDDQAVLDQILSKRLSQSSSGLRRLARLKRRIQGNKLITLEGSTGTGKSYLAHQAAKSSGPTFTLTIGPSAEESYLLKRWVWQQQGDDRGMKEQAEIILKWARTVPGPGEMVTLVVDEANLAAELLDNVLAGIWSDNPHIFCGSESVDISPRHRVVFTCNPGAYAGRSHQTVLQDRGTRVHYPALSPEFLKEQVVLPALNRIFQKTSLKGLDNAAARHAADRMMALQQQLKLLLPDRVFSPRDLTDACSWLAWQLHYSSGRVSKNQLDEMVWNAFDSVIAHSMYGETRESYQIVKLWFGHHYQIHQPIHKRPTTTVQKGYDLRLDALYRQFCDYVTGTKPEFDTSSQSVKSLMQTLAQDLDRLCLEHETGVRHSGRRATLVEGPAGRGKDATLKLLLDMWQAGDEKSQSTGVSYFNAGDCDWTELKKAIREAQQEGKVLVVSELNMISSADLEGELNDVLTEPCAPGFHLFATTNPPEYSGRSAFSPALNDRFRMVRIDDYHQQELSKIARQKLPPENRDQTAEHIAALHCYIHKRLKGSGQALFPVCRDLQNLAAAATPRSDLADLFSQHYFLYMEAGKITKEEVAEFLQHAMQQQQPLPVKSHRYDHTLCNWLFKTIPSLDRPIFIQRSKSSGFGVTQTRELVIDEKLSDSDAKREIIKRTVQWLWRQETDMPDEMGGWSDTESKSLYVMQKRQWFSTRIKSSEILPSDVFRLSGRQSDHQALQVSAGHREALKHLAGYRHILSEREIWERLLRGDLKVDIDKPASVWKACMKSACLPVAALCCLPVHVLSQCAPDLRPMAGEKLDGNVTYVPGTKKPQRNPVETGKVTGYGGGFRPIRRERTFYGEDINNYRLKFYRYKVTDNGNIYKTQLKPGKKDLIRVFPAEMVRPSANDVVQLYHGEAYGCHTINTGFNHQLLPLPGRFPREKVRALRTVPVRNYELFQDSYTGQHWIKFSGLTCKRPVQVHYQVEQKHSSAGLVEVASVNKVHHPQPVETQEQDNVCCLPAALFRRDHHQRGDGLVIPESNHCPEPIRYRVDNLFNTVRAAAETSLTELTNNQRLVLDIVNATDDSARIEAAADYCRQFDNESYRKITGSDDLAQILLSEAVGTCRHRAPVFKFILQYFGITCRIVESEIHVWAEVWNGYDWETYDLGGGDPDVGDDIHGYNPYFPKIRVQQYRERQTGKNSLAVLAPEVIEHFKKANPEGIKQGCERLSTCKQYDGFFWEQQRQVTDSLLASLNQMAGSGSDACIQVVGDIEHAQNCLDAPRQYNSSEKMWGFLKSVLKDHLKHCVEKNVTNTGWCSVLAAFVVQKKWLEPETESSHGLFENLRQWRWIEANIPPLKTLASRMIEYWYKLWRHSERTINISRRYTEQLNAMITEIDEDTVPTGCSETFETLLGAAAKFEQWTDQPEDGIPDVSRLLQGIPAYRKVASSQSQAGKPLFLLPNGFIDTRNQPEETQTRFAHYLYKRTQALKAPMCIGLAGREHFIFKPFQVVKPTSTVHVKNLLLNYDKLFVTDDPQWITRQKDNVEVLENTRIKKMMDCEDLVIIRPEDLQKIYDEYIESLGVSS